MNPIGADFFYQLRKPVAIVAHDAGGANMLAYLVKSMDLDIVPYMAGPALEIWRKVFGNKGFIRENLTELERSSTVISSTGWQSDFEHSARNIAKNANIRSIASLDHWVNYSQRFIRNSNKIYPDELIVYDSYAYQLARKEFPHINIIQVDNYYENFVTTAIRNSKILNLPSERFILYLAEPIRDQWGSVSLPEEFQALSYFLKIKNLIPGAGSKSIVLKPHPSEKDGKYENFLSKINNKTIKVDSSSSLIDLFSCAEVVVGCQSYAMTLSLAAGIPTYCSIPPYGPKCSLPMTSIKYLRDL